MKYILACLWLLCYFPFVNSFVADQNQIVTLYLENLQSFDDELTQEAWENCLSFLEENEINCCIQLKCQEQNTDDYRLFSWIKMLEDKGNCILHSKSCNCVKSIKMNFRDPDLKNMDSNDFRFNNHNTAASLPISTSPDDFQNQFRSQAGKNNVLYVKGDPTRWTRKQFLHFRSNINYLINLGITFNIPADSRVY